MATLRPAICLPHGGANRRLYGSVFEREISRGLIALKQGELLNELAELFRTGALVAHDCQLVLDERMVNQRDAAAVK